MKIAASGNEDDMKEEVSLHLVDLMKKMMKILKKMKISMKILKKID